MVSVVSTRKSEICSHLKAISQCWLWVRGPPEAVSQNTHTWSLLLAWASWQRGCKAPRAASQERELSENGLLWPVSKVNHLSCILLAKASYTNFSAVSMHRSHLSMEKKCHHLMVRRTCGMRDVLLWASLQNIICYYKQGNSKCFLLLKPLPYSVPLF